jgi:hypothetical protein
MWIARHQQGGYLHQFIFEQYPTEQQAAGLEAYCAGKYGTIHPVKGTPWFLRFEELKPLGAQDTIPVVDESAISSTSGVSGDIGAMVGEISVEGVGEVRNPVT